MADGLNRVLLLGNLGADPELRFTQGGQAVLNLRLAINESYLDKDKVRQERTEWVNVVVWGKRGEALAKILTKGSSIFVEGSLRSSSYDDRDGNKRYKTEINANNVVLTGGRGRGGEESDRPRNSPDGHGGYGGGRPSPGGGVDLAGVVSAGDFEVRFGRDAGKPISLVADLSWLRGVLVGDLDKPDKAQYRARNKSQILAIDEELTRRAGGALGGAAGDPLGELDGGGYGGGSDDDIPF